MKNKFEERKQWFIDRVGKRIFRDDNSCTCETCKTIGSNGLIIQNLMHATYLNDIEGEYNAEGHRLNYRDGN